MKVGGRRHTARPAAVRYLGFAIPLIIGLVAGGCSPARDASPGSLPPATIVRIEAIMRQKMADDGIPGMSIAIAVDGRLAWARGFGFADLEDSVPATAQTAYRSASIGKPMTATAAMQLVERGTLDLDTPIQRYCPAFPVKRWPVTTRQLLSHQSGIRHYGGPRNDEELYSNRHYESVVTALDIFKDDSLLFEPGTRYLYSTYGYNVVGCVIQGASGQPYLQYMLEHVFRPAHMSSTRDDDPAALIPHRAAGYVRGAGGVLRNAPAVDMSNKLPAGGFITTAPDLVAFATAVMDDALIGAETRAAMLTPQPTRDGVTTSYGLGWGLIPDEEWYGEKEALHGGGTPGMSGMLYLLPGRRFAVAVLMNLEGVADRVPMVAEIAKVALGLGGEGDGSPTPP